MARRPAGPARPQRTCVGCRQRADADELLRVVAVEGACVPDPGRRLPGRGAHLHPDPGCLANAERRRVWARALRLPVPPDTAALRRYVEEQTERHARPRAGRERHTAADRKRVDRR